MTSSQPAAPDLPVARAGFGAWMGSMWLYTLLRFALFGALWGLLYLLGMPVFAAALLGLVLSVPLSFVLLARPRARFARQIELRINARRVETTDLAGQLDPDADGSDADIDPQRATEAAKLALAAQRRRKQR